MSESRLVSYPTSIEQHIGDDEDKKEDCGDKNCDGGDDDGVRWWC